MTNIQWIQVLKCEYFVCFFVSYLGKLNNFGFWTAAQEKQAI